MINEKVLRYRDDEFEACCPLTVLGGLNGQIKIQIVSERGKTKWLNISPEEFIGIERVLLGE